MGQTKEKESGREERGREGAEGGWKAKNARRGGRAAGRASRTSGYIEERKRYSRVVLLLDEIEFLFDPLASVRNREFQSARSPAATAATLEEKRGKTKGFD